MSMSDQRERRNKRTTLLLAFMRSQDCLLLNKLMQLSHTGSVEDRVSQFPGRCSLGASSSIEILNALMGSRSLPGLHLCTVLASKCL